jgi:carbon monoxide dehydrogenase subunit G
VARIEHEVTIDRPVSEVFEFITRIDDLPEWQDSCKAVNRDDDGPVAVGTRWTETRTVMGRTSDQPMEVSALESDRRFTVRSVSGPVQMTIDHLLEAAGDGTRLRVVAEADLGGVSRLAGPMVKRQAQKMFEQDFAALKQRLESG